MRLRSTALDARSLEGARLWPNDTSGDSGRGPLPPPGMPSIDAFGDPMASHPQEVGGAVHDGASASRSAAMGAVRHGSLLHPGDPRVDPSVFAAFDAVGDAVARIRDLRSALSSRWHSDTHDDCRAVALIGLDASVEVASVSANLAVVCAQLGWPTLLIDGDIRPRRRTGSFAQQIKRVCRHCSKRRRDALPSSRPRSSGYRCCRRAPQRVMVPS